MVIDEIKECPYCSKVNHLIFNTAMYSPSEWHQDMCYNCDKFYKFKYEVDVTLEVKKNDE